VAFPRRDFGERDEDEPALGEPRVGNGQPLRPEDRVLGQEDVDIDASRAVTGTGRSLHPPLHRWPENPTGSVA
jgi:hypothetical protein